MRSLYLSLVAAALTMSACATAEQELVDQGRPQLSGSEIKAAFTDVREDYESRDRDTKLTAVGEWAADGAFHADWKTDANSGTVSGKWYVEDDLRCIQFDQDVEVNPECTLIYQTGDRIYTSIWPDGKIHGIHTLTPLP